MNNQKNEKKENDLVTEAKRFYESTMRYLIDNFITILLILFLIAMFTGIKEGCNAANE